MIIDDQGTLIIFQPENQEERDFLRNEVDSQPYQWLGNNLAVEHRFAQYLALGIQRFGFKIKPL